MAATLITRNRIVALGGFPLDPDALPRQAWQSTVDDGAWRATCLVARYRSQDTHRA